VKIARIDLSCHSLFLPEIALSAWMSASSFAGSSRCTFTLTRNVAAPAVVLFWSSSIASGKVSAFGAPTKRYAAFSPSPIHFVQLSAALGCRTYKAWALPQGCRVMP